MVICLERGTDLHMAQLMPLPLTVSCFSEIQIGFTFLVLAHLGSPGQRAIKWVCDFILHRISLKLSLTIFLEHQKVTPVIFSLCKPSDKYQLEQLTY